MGKKKRCLLGILFLVIFCGCANRVIINVKDNSAEINESVKKVELINANDMEAKLSKVYFDFDSYEIKDSESLKIFRNAMLLNQYTNLILQVEGHCDERGVEEYNLNLGKLRANAVRQQYIYLGVDVDRIKTISYGESKPVALGYTEKDWQLNRRVETKIIKCN